MSSQGQFVSSPLPLVALKSDASVEITTEGIKYLSSTGEQVINYPKFQAKYHLMHFLIFINSLFFH